MYLMFLSLSFACLLVMFTCWIVDTGVFPSRAFMMHVFPSVNGCYMYVYLQVKGIQVHIHPPIVHF